MISYNSDALWSINERLGEVARRLGAEEVPGLSMERLGLDYLDDVIEVASEEAEALDRAEEKANDAHRY